MKLQFLFMWCSALLLLASTGCLPTASAEGYEVLNERIDDELKNVGLGAGDVFEVRVFGEKELSQSYRVDAGGFFDFPLIGRVQTKGLTPSALEKEIATRLREGYLRDPSVSVLVREYTSRKILVLGDVASPGKFGFTRGVTVVEAIALAGGFLPTANTDFVVVTRRVQGEETRITVPVGQISRGLAANLELLSGDIVFVPDTLF